MGDQLGSVETRPTQQSQAQARVLARLSLALKFITFYIQEHYKLDEKTLFKLLSLLVLM